MNRNFQFFAIQSVVFVGLCLPVTAQELHRRPKPDKPKYVENCIEVQLWRDKSGLRYKYLTEEPYGGNLKYDLGELKLTKPADCRINVIVDDTAGVPDLAIVPIWALEAGFTNVHVYVHWKYPRTMAEIHFRPDDKGRDEVVYGHVQRFSKRHPPKDM